VAGGLSHIGDADGDDVREEVGTMRELDLTALLSWTPSIDRGLSLFIYLEFGE
jgi:hypothetical protein